MLASALVDTLRQQRLLEPPQLAELADLSSRFSEPRGLAQELIRRGWLTPLPGQSSFRVEARIWCSARMFSWTARRTRPWALAPVDRAAAARHNGCREGGANDRGGMACF